MKVLITGGFGYLGGRLAQFLASRPDHEIRLGTRRCAEPPAWLPTAQVVPTFWSSRAELERACRGADAVVHLAGMNAQACAADPVAALESNGVATARLTQAAVRQGVRRFVYLSTAHVYDSLLTGAVTEQICPGSLHPYATSHRAGEDAVRAAHGRGEIEGVVIRLSNAFGAPAHEDADCWSLLCNDLCRQAVAARRVVLRSSGRQRRDFITLTDACRAIGHLLALPGGRLGDGLFNVGGAWSPTILEVAEGIQEVAGRKLHAAVDLSVPPATDAAAAPPFTYCIDKLTQTGFVLSADHAAEMERLLDFCMRPLR